MNNLGLLEDFILYFPGKPDQQWKHGALQDSGRPEVARFAKFLEDKTLECKLSTCAVAILQGGKTSCQFFQEQ